MKPILYEKNIRPFLGEGFSLMDRLFDNIVREPEYREAAHHFKADVIEDEEAFRLLVEVPGMKEDEVDITLEDGVLTLKAERKHESEEKNERFHRIERSYGSFQRSFQLPENVDEETIEANQSNGVLEVTLPKIKVEPQSKTKKIEVKSN